MKVVPTAIPDVLRVEPTVYGDDRGFFLETWHAARYAELGLAAGFVQDNHSRSAGGVLRGLHYQIGRPQGKLVRVVSGEVFDVAVDLRRSSPTFGRWVGETLSAASHRQLWVPPGFAHGFYVTSDSADLMYKCTDYYAPEHECTLRWDDPALGIEWPLRGGAPALSAKDSAGLALRDAPTFA
jgi:dTDP-4-dehydrorhamnose 3,5-epimerase